ncbi:MAG: alkyl hydroperoxide reductase subunit AhpC [Myxococcota bacterium]|jgi:alkyl hydroperoxide reductase subunit AhpC
MGAELITVSCDTHFSHLAWHTVEKELKDVKFKMGSDKTAALARQFGVYLEDAGLSLRGTFLISPEGTLLFSEVNFLNVGRNVDELMRKFKAALYVSKKDEGIPPSWNEEGDLTLKPSAKMVGKVHEALANDGNPV